MVVHAHLQGVNYTYISNVDENEKEEAEEEEVEKIDQNPNSSNTSTDVAGKTVASEKPTASVPRSVLKTRQAYAQETTPAKRKARLKEVEFFSVTN